MRNALKGIYEVQNPEKYEGTHAPIYRSSWERDFMVYCDHHPGVLKWASEPVQIPYSDPLTGKQKVYIPDFLVTFIDSNKDINVKLIEIKPMKEALNEHARSSEDRALVLRNQAKWGAATAWAMRRGIDFIFWTEKECFSGYQNAPTPARRARQIKLQPKKPKLKKATVKTHASPSRPKARARRKLPSLPKLPTVPRIKR